jgi:hypothetical protein
MADELNIPTHRWYEPRNNIPLAKEDFSRQWIYNSGIQKIDAWISAQPWGDIFSPLSLFASGEEGAWYEPSTTTAFLSTTDLTPCTYGPLGGECGFLLDKSQGAGYADGSFTGLGSELVAGGEFNDAGDVAEWTETIAGASVSWNSGQIQLNGGSGGSRPVQALTTVSGRSYVVTWSRTGGTATQSGVRATNNSDGSSDGSGRDFLGITDATYTRSAYFTATASTTYLALGGQVNLTTLFDNISVRELPGNHATQTAPNARPHLARVPETGRRNLLERTEEFDDAWWNSSNTAPVTANTTVDPNGNTTADTLTIDDTAYVSATLPETENSPIGTSFTFSVYVKGTNGDVWTIGINANDVATRWTDLSAGAFPRSGVEYVIYKQFTLDGTWQRLELSGTTTTAVTGEVIAYVGESRASVSPGTTSLVTAAIWGAQLELGSTATDYQKVVSEYDVTEAGVTSLDYLSFDGSDDFMTSGTNADWKYLHDGTGCEWIIGLTPKTVANPNNLETVFSTSTSATAYVGMSLGVDDRSSIPRNNAWRYSVERGVSNATLFGVVTNDTITSLTENYVVRGGHKSSETPQYFMYDDEVLEYSGSYENTPPSTANSYGPLTLGATATANGFNWSGNLFSLIIRDTQMTAGERSAASAYVAAKSGVTL